jgi:hypothetical protein
VGEVGCDEGLGVVVAGEEGARGMELTSRSDASGRVFITRGGSVEVDAGGEVEVEVEGERNGCGACDDFSIQAARAEGSTGQADGGG